MISERLPLLSAPSRNLRPLLGVVLMNGLLALDVCAASADFVTLPNPTNAVQLRLYTNAAPDATHLFNTLEIAAYGERLLASPGGDSLSRRLAINSTNHSLHSLVVNGCGPELSATNSMILVERAAGPDWVYLALDASAAYRSQLKEYRRGIVFVAPDLFVVHDHLVASSPARFEMFLHPPVTTRLDPVWHDLRLELPTASLRINAPSRGALRSWEHEVSPGDKLFPKTRTFRLGPTNQLAQLDLITVFAAYRAGEKGDYVFKLVESNNAIGARILRAGLPSIVAFKTDSRVPTASVAGLNFSGPVGVGVFRPQP